MASPDSTIHMKYPGQARFCLGIAAVQLQDGTIEGRRCAPLDYTGKQVVMIADYKKSRNEEIHCIKSLKMGGSGWVGNIRKLGVFLEEQWLSELKVKGLGKATVGKLEKNDISIVSKVKNLTSAEIGAIVVIKENKITKKIRILTLEMHFLHPSLDKYQIVPHCIIRRLAILIYLNK